MKTKTLLMVAGAGALAYLLWRGYKMLPTEANKAQRQKRMASNQYECEEVAGGKWVQVGTEQDTRTTSPSGAEYTYTGLVPVYKCK